MCYHSQQTKSATELKNRFKVVFKDEELFKPSIYNGFSFPKTPVITNKEPTIIQLYNWGLLPSWTSDISFRKNTLNAKIETLHEKPSFKPSLNKRCLVLSNGFFEWQWLDSKGTKKQKYFIHTTDNDAFAFAGLYNEWVDKSSGEILNTYTIITTEANELMSEIHNTKKRMPVILHKSNEVEWLNGGNLLNNNMDLQAEKI